MEALSTKIGQSYSISRSLITSAWLDFGQAADLDKLEAALQQVLTSNPKVSFVEQKSISSGIRT